MNQENKLMATYECLNCGSIINVDKYTLKSEVNCLCGKPRVELLAIQTNDGDEKLVNKKLNDCYQDIQSLMNFYLDMPQEAIKLVSLWIIGTYLHKEFNSFPFLFINAMRGSGKSRLLNFITHLARNGKLTNNITEAVLFRTATNHTLIIDEIESILKKDKSSLRELLNSAYKKGTGVERMKKVKSEKGEDLVVERFELFTPIAMANINGMEEVLADRCISIILEKSDNLGKTKLMEDFDSNEGFKSVKRTLGSLECSLCSVVSQKNIKKAWNNYISSKYFNYYNITTQTTLTTLTTLDSEEEIQKDKTNSIKETTLTTLTEEQIDLFNRIDELKINGRNLELFFPLIVIGQLLGEEVFRDILEIAKNHINEKRTQESQDSPDIALYEFVSKQDPLRNYKVSELLLNFKNFYVGDETDRDWINTKWLGRALRRLKLVISSNRKNYGMEALLDVGKAQEKIKMFKVDSGEKDA